MVYSFNPSNKEVPPGQFTIFVHLSAHCLLAGLLESRFFFFCLYRNETVSPLPSGMLLLAKSTFLFLLTLTSWLIPMLYSGHTISHPSISISFILQTRKISCAICFFSQPTKISLLQHCGSLNRNGPYRFICLNVWPSGCGITAQGLGGVALQEEVCHCGWALGFKYSSQAQCLSLLAACVSGCRTLKFLFQHYVCAHTTMFPDVMTMSQTSEL